MNSEIGGVEFDGVNEHNHRPSALTSHNRASSQHSATVTGFRRLVPIDRTAIAAVALAVAAVLAWLSAKDFALGTQPDELVKMQAVLAGQSSYFHPILMIDLVRAANAFLGLIDPQSVVELGRAFSAAAGGVLIVATFILARLMLPASAAFAVAAATLATPLISVHARYFKEDIFVAPFVILALAALVAVLRTPTLMRVMMLGAAIGLAGGSKYVGGVILLPYALAVMVAFGHRGRIGARLTHAGIAAFTAVGVLGLIEIPAFLAGNQILSDLRLVYVRAARGHPDIVLPITLTWGIFHLRESLWPGLGPLLTVLGVLGLSAPFFSAPERRQPLAVIAGFTVIWYLAHEISPLKPYPDFARYMVPLAPLLVILATASINEWAERYRPGAGAIVATAAVLLVAAVSAGWQSLRVNVQAHDDPRRLLPEIVATAPGHVAVDSYAGYQMRPFLAQLGALPSVADTTIIVTSSFNYDRYRRYGALPQQSAQTRAGAQFYAQVLALPRLDVSNGRPSFSFFNPTTTIIAMDGNAERLLPIANMIETIAPSLFVRWNRPQPTSP
jgi:4-amino-4-deoxy-L-arabinose transferase-like glycosyltransferase